MFFTRGLDEAVLVAQRVCCVSELEAMVAAVLGVCRP
jgi:hypothetical protein